MERTGQNVGGLRDRCSDCHRWIEKDGWWSPPLMEGEVAMMKGRGRGCGNFDLCFY